MREHANQTLVHSALPAGSVTGNMKSAGPDRRADHHPDPGPEGAHRAAGNPVPSASRDGLPGNPGKSDTVSSPDRNAGPASRMSGHAPDEETGAGRIGADQNSNRARSDTALSAASSPSAGVWV